jgi:hypothetical protein
VTIEGGPVVASPLPVPPTATTVGALLALLASVTVPLTVPADVGAKAMSKEALCPAGRYIGSEGPLAVKAELDKLSCERTTVALPVFVTATEWELVSPSGILPKLSLAGFADNTPAGFPPVPPLAAPASFDTTPLHPANPRTTEQRNPKIAGLRTLNYPSLKFCYGLRSGGLPHADSYSSTLL